jgi:hypothetical protein
MVSISKGQQWGSNGAAPFLEMPDLGALSGHGRDKDQ